MCVCVCVCLYVNDIFVINFKSLLSDKKSKIIPFPELKFMLVKRHITEYVCVCVCVCE